MSIGSGRGPQQQRIVVRETDTYVEHRSGTPTPDAPPPRSRTLLQPIAVSTLIGCVVWSIAQFISVAFSVGSLTLFSTVPVLMSLVGFATQRIAQKRFQSGSDRMRFSLVELAVLFLAVKLATLLGSTIPELLVAVRTWSEDPLTFFDTATVLTYLVGAGAWLMAGLTARDLDAIADPTMYAGETKPTTRLVSRYFYGGAVLLVFTALTRVSLIDLIRMDNPRIRNPILNVLIYFFLGVAMLGEVQYTRLSELWRREKVTVTENLGATWVRYSFLFVGLAALIAFLLPTSYTVSLLDLVTMLARMISYVATLLYLLLLLPFMMLLSLFTGKEPSIEVPETPSMPFTTPPPAVAGEAGGSWWAVIQSLVFWGVLLTIVVYLLRSYFRDRPGVLNTLKRLAPWRLLASVWVTVGNWLRKLGRGLAIIAPALAQHLRHASSGAPRRGRARGSSPREQLLYHYLTTLDRAREAGWPRRHNQTPHEYQGTLTAHLAEGQEAMENLTGAFIEARYSTHPVTSQDVTTQQMNAARVRRGLRKRGEP